MNDDDPLFAEVKVELDRHERLERYCSFAAMIVAIVIIGTMFEFWGLVPGVLAGFCFFMGVIAQRIR